MSDELSHLRADAAALLAEDDERRVRAIRSRRWVLYPRGKQALDRLSGLLDYPRGTRMPSVAIYGDSGMGKTMIMKRFRDNHPPSFDPITGTLRTPVLAMEMTSRPGERRFYAFGRADGTWSKARGNQWIKISGTSNNHHVELFSNYFCPPGSPAVSSVDEAQGVLRHGGQMSVPNR